MINPHPSERLNRVILESCTQMVRQYHCENCNAGLQRRGARCGNCGWATCYDLVARHHDVVQGISIVVLSVLIAIAVTAFVVEFVRPNL